MKDPATDQLVPPTKGSPFPKVSDAGRQYRLNQTAIALWILLGEATLSKPLPTCGPLLKHVEAARQLVASLR